MWEKNPNRVPDKRIETFGLSQATRQVCDDIVIRHYVLLSYEGFLGKLTYLWDLSITVPRVG